MINLAQTDPRWKNVTLGTGNLTIGKAGCFVTSFAMLAGMTPPEVNRIFIDKGVFANGDMMQEKKAAEALGLPYKARTTNQPSVTPCIAETNHYAPSVPQHFFIWLGNGRIIDSLDGREKPDNTYRIVSFRNISTKEDQVTNEQAKLLIYKATQGHEPTGDERAFAMGGISPDELAVLRFGDDVIATAWTASNGDVCPDSEKKYWANAQRDGNSGHPVDTFGRTWFGDHVLPKIKAEQDKAEALQATINSQEVELNEVHQKLQKLNEEMIISMNNKAQISGDLLLAREELKTCKEATPTEMTATEMIIQGIRKILRIQ